MNKNIIITISIFILLIIFSKKLYFNKWIGYESIPNTYIFDEHDYPFVGYSFRKTGVPTGWSTMEIYKQLSDKKQRTTSINYNGISITSDHNLPSLKNKNDFNYPVTYVTDVDIGKGNETIRIVQPFFDHPIFGSWLYSLNIKNADTFDEIKPADYRLISLYLSIFTGLLIFLFSYLLFKNIFVSFLSFIIYSTVPEYILMSRFSLLENILIPLSLLTLSSILISQKFKDSRNSLFLVLAGITSGLAFLTKESGIFIYITSLIILFSQKINFKKIIIFTTPFILLSAIYYCYMYCLSPDLFFKLLFDQANREWFGPLSFFYQIVQPNFSGFPKSGYWLFGVISLVSLYIKNQKKYINLFIPFVVYLFIFLFMGGLNYPWYYLPFIPYIVIASSVMIYKTLISPDLSKLILFYLLIFSSSFYWGYFVYHSNQNNYLVFRLSLVIFIALFFIKKIKKLKFSNILWYIFFIVILLQIYQWNNQGLLYIISNWNHLSSNFSFPI